MDQTALKVGTTPIGVNGAALPAKDPVPKPKTELKQQALKVLLALASLRITVTLFAIAMVLVFWGTLAQADAGIWTVVGTYFRGFLVWVPLKVICFNCVDNLTTRIPFPGGMTLGIIMMVNLLAAHAIRFKMSWNRAGIFLIHAGIIVMMLGELLTGLYAVEQQMSIPIGQTVNFVYNTHKTELAFVTPIDAKKDDVIVVPGSMLTTGAKVHDDRLPFDVEVLEYMVNSDLAEARGKNRATQGVGVTRGHMAKRLPEVPGADAEQRVDMPSAYVRLSRGGKDLGTWLFSVYYSDIFMNFPQEVTVDGKTYRVSLRFQQSVRPYSIRLDKAAWKFHPGTQVKSEYRSYIHLKDPTTGYEQDMQIYMNAPMFYRGETFYQAGMDAQDRVNPDSTTFQVVQNPGWTLPYLSCAIVGFGLLIHFGYTLYRFLQRRAVR